MYLTLEYVKEVCRVIAFVLHFPSINCLDNHGNMIDKQSIMANEIPIQICTVGHDGKS